MYTRRSVFRSALRCNREVERTARESTTVLYCSTYTPTRLSWGAAVSGALAPRHATRCTGARICLVALRGTTELFCCASGRDERRPFCCTSDRKSARRRHTSRSSGTPRRPTHEQTRTHAAPRSSVTARCKVVPKSLHGWYHAPYDRPMGTLG